MQETFHKYELRLQRTRARIQDSRFSSTNKHQIFAFADHCFSHGLSVPRVEKYLGHLKVIASLLHKDFDKVGKTDIEQLVRTIERSGYSEWTKRDFRITLKKFYRWLRGSERDPVEVAWLRSDAKNNNHKLPEELLSEEDITKLIDACRTRRDRALVSVLYESGCRIGEIGSLRIKHVVPHRHGLQLTVFGKTGARRLLIVSSVLYLTDWLNVHPRKSDPHSYLWVTSDCRASRICYSRIATILKAAAKRAGVAKRVNPHTFRHSRATYLANHLTEAQMCEFFGWVQGSDMAPVYVHLSGRDVDNALLRTYGISPDGKESGESKFKPKNCRRCSQQNPPTNKYCSRCGTALDEKTAVELTQRDSVCSRAEEVLERLIRDRQFRDMLETKVKQLASPRR